MAEKSDFDSELLLSYRFPETTFTYSDRDAVVYALGVGACGRDAVDPDELKYLYHENGQKHIQVLPTFAALFSHGSVPDGLDLPGFEFDRRLLLHGQQYIELYKPLPSSGCIQNKVSIAGLHDKGKAAILEIESKNYDKESGELICMNRVTGFLRGAGGFSKSSLPFSYSNYPTNQVPAIKIPKDQPFAVFEDCTQPSQALLYRLSGDYNPLHSDPMFAKIAGFSRPILHGRCTLGFAVRAIIKCICRGDPSMVKNISGRFLLHVYPGETLVTEMWLEGSRVIYQTKAKDRNRTVLSGFVDLHQPHSPLSSHANEAFSRALVSIPTTIADNAGLDSSELIAQPPAVHHKEACNAGIDVISGSVGDMAELGISEAFKVKQAVLLSATEAAEMILRVDER